MIVTAVAISGLRPIPGKGRRQQPAIIAVVVMRIGRSRVRHASRAPAQRQSPGAKHVGVIHLQNGVLLHDAEEQQDAERALQVQRPPGGPDRQQRERHRQREHQHDDDRLHEALGTAPRAPCTKMLARPMAMIRLSVRLVEVSRLPLHARAYLGRHPEAGDQSPHVVRRFVEARGASARRRS